MSEYKSTTKYLNGIVWLPVAVNYVDDMDFKEVEDHVYRMYKRSSFFGSHVDATVIKEPM